MCVFWTVCTVVKLCSGSLLTFFSILATFALLCMGTFKGSLCLDAQVAGKSRVVPALSELKTLPIGYEVERELETLLEGSFFANRTSASACVWEVPALPTLKVLGRIEDAIKLVLGLELTSFRLVSSLATAVFITGDLRTLRGRRCRIPELSSGTSENLTFLRFIVLSEDFIGDRDLVHDFKIIGPVLLLFAAVRFEVKVDADVDFEDEVVEGRFFLGILYEPKECRDAFSSAPERSCGDLPVTKFAVANFTFGFLAGSNSEEKFLILAEDAHSTFGLANVVALTLVPKCFNRFSAMNFREAVPLSLEFSIL